MPLPPATAFRPLPVRAMNRLFPRLWEKRVLPPPDLEETTLDDMAIRATGLSDFGDPWFRGPLRQLLPALREEAALNPLGRVIAHGALLKMLKERLWAEARFAADPSIRQRALARPIIVVGHMRSGTTRLHRLLAADERFAHLKLYEAMCPVPWPTSRPGRDPRIAYTQRGWRALNWVNPGNAAVHPTSALEPDEELGVLENSAWGAQIEAQRRVPSYARWCEREDATPAYARVADLLRLTGHFRGEDPAKPWVLKTPQHMQDLAALDRVFPDARLIFIRRDPVRVVASAASLAWNQMVVQSDHVDPHWVGAEWLAKTVHRQRACDTARAAIDPKRQLDLTFDEMDTDWESAMRRVYAFLDMDIAPALPAMRRYIAGAKAHRAHRYALEDFGLSEGAVREALSV